MDLSLIGSAFLNLMLAILMFTMADWFQNKFVRFLYNFVGFLYMLMFSVYVYQICFGKIG